MSLVVFFFIGSVRLCDLVGVLDGEPGRRRGIGLRRGHQIVEAFITAVEILVLLLHIVQGGLLGGGSQRALALVGGRARKIKHRGR